MSAATEIAAREAAEAEAEHPDDDENAEAEAEDENGEPEPEPSTEPEPPMSEKEIEAANRKLDAENERHAKRIEQIMGPDFAELSPCPCCQIPGYVFPFQEYAPGDIIRKDAVLAYFGSQTAKLREHPSEIRCETCDGWGSMSNGSRVEGNSTSLCPKCAGMGHVTRPAPATQTASNGFQNVQTGYFPYEAPPAVTAPPAPSEPGPPSGWQPEPGRNGNDSWGRWPGHARYGIDPTASGGQW